MELSYQPIFQLLADGQDITARINQNLIKLTVTDNAGGESDKLTLELHGHGLNIPKKGASLRVALGFNGELVPQGAFTVDKASIRGWPEVISVSATAANFSGQRGQPQLQAQRTQAWDDITLGDLMATVATRNNLQYRVSQALAATHLSHVDQVNESDINLLTRLARQHGAVSKIANDTWLLLEDGAGTNAAGQPVPVVPITPGMCSDYSASFDSRGGLRGCSASYHDPDTGEKGEVGSSAGKEGFRIVYTYPSKAEAEAAVRARTRSTTQNQDSLTLTLPGTLSLLRLRAEGYLQLTGGWRPQLERRWRVKTITKTLEPGKGIGVAIAGDTGGKTP